MTVNHGFVIIDKPSGITSHDVVAQLRKKLGTKRVGHAGTLDPMATGVLVLGINNATKFSAAAAAAGPAAAAAAAGPAAAAAVHAASTAAAA